MVRLSCFSPRPHPEEWDIHSHHSAESAPEPVSHLEKRKSRWQTLFPNTKRVPTREAAKQRLKKILNVKKDPSSAKDRQVEDDHEFIVLGKIYSELDATVDLASIARNRATLSHLLPFVLNTLLYGFDDRLGSRVASNRSGRKSSNSRVVRDPKEITLGGTSHLVKAQCERQLESFLYQQAMNSVSFALECLWYLTGSLYLGPKESYHRTMTLLLGMESVVTSSTPPGDLFKKAEVTETAHIASSSTSPPSTGDTGNTPSDETDSIQKNTDTIQKNTDIVTRGESLARHSASLRVDLDITGSGENDHRMEFNALQLADERKLQHWLEARRERASIFHAQLDFVKCLTHISHGLFDVDIDLRRDVLRRELEKLNDFLPTNVFIPTDRRPHRVLRIVPEDAHVFSTKERVPYLLVVEVEDLCPDPHERERHSEEHRQHGPLRRIGSLSSPGGMKRDKDGHGHGHGLSHGLGHGLGHGLSHGLGHGLGHGHGHGHGHGQGHGDPLSDEIDQDIPMQNQPGQKFEFSPDVTADGGSALLKRESSLRADTTNAEDRRPPDEELLKALGERWAVKSERLRKASPFGARPNWRLVSCIVKARDQLRQEMFAQRLIQEFARIFDRAGIPCWLRAYQILSTSSDSGLIETLTDAKSIDSIKKHSPNVVTLQDYFVGVFGGRGSHGYKRAVRSFVQSMAGYSIVQYLLNIKDRHNGNLMIDADGHVIHIDFGFFLSNSPGGNMEFEKAPFKLTNEMVQVMGGTKSGAWKLFRKLCVQGYLEVSRYAPKIMLMVDTMYPGNESMPCFLQGRDYVLQNLRARFGVDLSRKERVSRMLKLIDNAHGNWTTRAYDQYQRISLNIAK